MAPLVAALVKYLGPVLVQALASKAGDSSSKLGKGLSDKLNDVSADDVVAAMNSQPKGVEGWQSLAKEGLGDMLINQGIKTAGNIASATGNMTGARNSILGAALQAVAARNKNAGIGDLTTPLTMAGAGLIAKGAAAKIAGDAAGKTAEQWANANYQRNEGARRMQFQMNNNPPGEFYRSLGAATTATKMQ